MVQGSNKDTQSNDLMGNKGEQIQITEKKNMAERPVKSAGFSDVTVWKWLFLGPQASISHFPNKHMTMLPSRQDELIWLIEWKSSPLTET